MDVKQLRILTWKSKLGFGKYLDLTVSQIFMNHHTAYLRWVYYNLDGISFNDDVLYKIGVITDNRDSRIKKAGIDKIMYEQVESIYRKAVVKKGFSKGLKKEWNESATRNLKTIEKEEGIKYSKKNLQWINQGHRFR